MYSDHLDLTTFNDLLRTEELGKSKSSNEVWDEIDSTNTHLAQLAREGAPHGLIVAARQQNAGRGRQGRVWASPKDAGLYISFLLRPKIALTELPLISLATGTAVARAVQEVCGVKVGLKWVNDIILDGRKLGGILAEMPNREAVVIGCGINLRVVERPPELAAKAVALEEAAGDAVDVNLLAAQLAFELEQNYSLLCKGERTQVIEEWKLLSVTLGKVVRATTGGAAIEGTAIGVERDGALIVETVDGEQHRLHAGEISIRNVDGSYA